MIRSNSIPKKVWKFVHTNDVWIKTNIFNKSFSSDWLEIEDDGLITVKGSRGKGYAWDGCSPKFEWLDLLFGTPDGKPDYSTCQPMTYYASMIHDAMYQYKKGIPISRGDADKIFFEILKKSHFKLSSIYNFFVVIFGCLYGEWDTKSPVQDIQIFGYSWLPEEGDSPSN